MCIGEDRPLKDQGLGCYVVLYFSLGSIFNTVLKYILLHSSVITYFILISLQDQKPYFVC